MLSLQSNAFEKVFKWAVSIKGVRKTETFLDGQAEEI